MSADAPAAARIDRAAPLPDDARAALHDLLLTLADGKRVLGVRYSDRMLGAPTLEAGIAASSMAQDEWGHGRLTYALLGDFGAEPKALEHGRPAAEYRSMDALDALLDTWSDLIAAALVVDTALTVQYGALADSRYGPARNRVQKMLDEERFHFQYAVGWARRVAAVEAVRDELRDAFARVLPLALRWFGPEDAATARRLREEGLVTAGPDALRTRLLGRIGPVLEELGMAEALGVARGADGWTYAAALDWSGWDEATRRAGGSLDETTAARARGDRNRALLLD